MTELMQHFYHNPSFGEFWFTYPTLYSYLAEKCRDGDELVEVGVWKGRSLCYLAVECINRGKPNSILHAVDTWEGSNDHKTHAKYSLELPTLYDTYLKNIEPVEHMIRTHRTTSVHAASTFEDNSLFSVFIDAAHDTKSVLEDIEAWYPKVRTGGILCGHDYDCSNPNGGVNQAVIQWATKNGKKFGVNPMELWWCYIKE